MSGRFFRLPIVNLMEDSKAVYMYQDEFEQRHLWYYLLCLEVPDTQKFDATTKRKTSCFESFITCVILSIDTEMEKRSLFLRRPISFDIENIRRYWKVFTAIGESDHGTDPVRPWWKKSKLYFLRITSLSIKMFRNDSKFFCLTSLSRIWNKEKKRCFYFKRLLVR